MTAIPPSESTSSSSLTQGAQGRRRERAVVTFAPGTIDVWSSKQASGGRSAAFLIVERTAPKSLLLATVALGDDETLLPAVYSPSTSAWASGGDSGAVWHSGIDGSQPAAAIASAAMGIALPRRRDATRERRVRPGFGTSTRKPFARSVLGRSIGGAHGCGRRMTASARSLAKGSPWQCRDLLDALARGHRGMVLGLDRVHAALAAVGHPERDLPAFHIAGSNGKGSVAAMVDAALAEAGIRRGLFTSPHLERFNERIAIDGAPIGDDAFAEALARALVDAPDLTFFETLTVAAFLAFREAKIDVAVLEVGLGGRLDATNVVDEPLAAAIVSITVGEDGRHLEHADLLGDTVEAITREKAGIFKRGAPAVIGPLEPRAARVARMIARDVGAQPLVEVAKGDPDLNADSPTFGRDTRIPLRPTLLGAHQIANAAVAAAALPVAQHRLPTLSSAHIEAGIAHARWPGRLEHLDLGAGRPYVLLDAAHNLDGARALVAALPGAGLTPDRPVRVFGSLAGQGFTRRSFAW